ncbi:MAG TPA: hypothetical protein VFA66_10945 [Gaiellaceae bacterium]|nr:hypothetical protein [Gaiellaceae bacterium]
MARVDVTGGAGRAGRPRIACVGAGDLAGPRCAPVPEHPPEPGTPSRTSDTAVASPG